jgi:putative transposase
MDVSLKTFAIRSTGTEIANPRFFRQEEQSLAKAQRRLSQAEHDIPECAERRKGVARVDEGTCWVAGAGAPPPSRRSGETTAR